MKGTIMYRKISVLALLVIASICATGCSSANVYTSSSNRVTGLKRPDISNKGVIVVLSRTRNYVDINQGLRTSPCFRKEGVVFFVTQSVSEGGGPESQIFQATQNKDNFELWQIFTLAAKPGRYSLSGFAVAKGAQYIEKSGHLGSGFPASKNTFEVKQGQFLYVGMLNFDATGRRDGLGKIISGSISNVKYWWDSSPEKIEFIYKKIPELKNVGVINQPLSIDFK